MHMPFSFLSATPLARAAAGSRSRWIFGDMPEGVALMLIKALIIVGTVGAICLLLRLLYGPGGPLRPQEFGTGHIAERKERNALLKELKRQRRAGTITKREYLERRWDVYHKR